MDEKTAKQTNENHAQTERRSKAGRRKEERVEDKRYTVLDPVSRRSQNKPISLFLSLLFKTPADL